MTTRPLWLVFFLVLLNLKAYSQQRINGKVVRPDQQAVEGAHIVVTPSNNLRGIVGFTFTDSKGQFSISLNYNADSIGLLVRALGYEEKFIPLPSCDTTLLITLKVKEYMIDDVIVKSQPIKQKGDTITYLVSSFARGGNFSVADVIKNMPNFNVTEEGTILYEGKPIQNFYVEGMDLMGGNYNTIVKNLPFKSVGAIDVYKNHQPYKILRKLIPSEATAVNVRLKQNVTYTGHSEVGSGYEPALYDINITPMAFKKQSQLLASFQANNVGQELESQFNIFEYSGGNFNKYLFYIPNQVNVSLVPQPNITRRRFYDNNTAFFSFNSLHKISNDNELKFNISAYTDRNYLAGHTATTYPFSDSTITFKENTSNRFNTHAIKFSGTFSKNSENRFFKSFVSVRSFWKHHFADLYGNSDSISQHANLPSIIVNNENKIISKKGNSLSEYYLNFNHIATDQSIDFTPGILPEVFNFGAPYSNISQIFRLSETDLLAHFKRSRIYNFLRVSVRPSLNLQSGRILTQMEKDNQKLAVDSLLSNKKWWYLKQELSPSVAYQRKWFQAELFMPVSIRYLSQSDINHPSNGKFNTWFEPGLSIKSDITPNWEFSGSINLQKKVFEPDESYNGIIIKNQYLIMRQEYLPYGNTNLSMLSKLSYSNAVKGVHFSTGFSKSYGFNKYITERNYSTFNYISYKIAKLDNRHELDRYSLNFSYLISQIFTQLSLDYKYTHWKQDNLSNGELHKIHRFSHTVSANANTSYFDGWEFDYKLKYNAFLFKPEKTNFSNTLINNIIGVTYYYSSKTLLGFECDWHVTPGKLQRNTSLYFFNVFMTHRFANNRYSLKLMLENLFNVNCYETFYHYSNSLVSSSVSLRPRFFLVSFTMPLYPPTGTKP